MKKYIKCPLFIAALGLIILGGCKKNSSKTDTGTTTGGTSYVKTKNNTNPLTASATCDYDMSDTAYTNHGWTKAFDDELTGLSNWTAVTGGVENELELNQAANAQVSNGILQISARQQTVTGPKSVGNDTTQSFNYTSAWIVSNQSFSANSTTPKVRIVARMKVSSGVGLSSIFYAFGDNWPTNGEIDAVEYQSNDPKVFAFNYNYGSQPDKDLVTGGLIFNPTTEDLSACYHVYMLEWTQSSLNTYLDGNLVGSITGTYVPNLFGKSMHLSLSLPIGGLYYPTLNASTVTPGAMYVDYVKVFTSN